MRKPKYHRIFNYDKDLLPNKRLAALEKGVSNIDQAMAKSGFTIGYPGWNLLYYSVLCGLDRERENTVVETGSNWGCSTIVLGQAIKDSGLPGHVYSVEIDPANYEKAVHNVAKAGLDQYVSLVLGNSSDYLKSLAAREPYIRFAFLDGGHDLATVIDEFEAIYPLLDDYSMVFFDNTYRISSEGEDLRVNGALKVIMQRFGGNLINFENTSWYTPGQAIWQRHGFKRDWED